MLHLNAYARFLLFPKPVQHEKAKTPNSWLLMNMSVDISIGELPNIYQSEQFDLFKVTAATGIFKGNYEFSPE